MLFTAYGNCQADVLSNLLQQSPEFAERYKLARLRPCFAVSEQEIGDWVGTSAPDVHLLITQKLRKGWRGNIEVFDTDWLTEKCAPDVLRLEWTDMYYTAYEPHMAYPITFPRRQPADYINILHLMTYANGLDWRRMEPFYVDESIFPPDMIEDAHAASLSELVRREADCSLGITPFIAEHWRKERLFLTFNHPTRPVVRHAAQQIVAAIGIDASIPEKGYFGFRDATALPLLASFDGILANRDKRPVMESFFLGQNAISAHEYFDRWEASFAELGREKVAAELAAQGRDNETKHVFIEMAKRYLGIAG